jgi:antitoxin (DNA-binding transcriptional repressor) of toxin-antitoxin stability system
VHNELITNDIRYVVQRLPRDIRDLMSNHPGKVFVGGGFIRATIAGEVPSDIDVFGHDKEYLVNLAENFAKDRPGSKLHRTGNAITVLTPQRLPVQFITRWTFKKPVDLVSSFDFTVCQAAIWRGGPRMNDPWQSFVGSRFYIDLAARRLVYTNPVREEEAGGSLLRVIKYVNRGYTIQVTSLGAVVARLTTAMRDSRFAGQEPASVLGGLLREVDPLLVIDGFDVVDDHEPVEGEQ